MRLVPFDLELLRPRAAEKALQTLYYPNNPRAAAGAKEMAMRIMMCLLGILLFAPGQRAQEPVPTTEACRANRIEWYGQEARRTDYLDQQSKQIKNGTTNTNPFAKLSLREVLLRSQVMGLCVAVDPQNRDQYAQTQNFYSGIQADRTSGFLKRHNLYQQVLSEDDAGIR